MKRPTGSVAEWPVVSFAEYYSFLLTCQEGILKSDKFIMISIDFLQYYCDHSTMPVVVFFTTTFTFKEVSKSSGQLPFRLS